MAAVVRCVYVIPIFLFFYNFISSSECLGFNGFMNYDEGSWPELIQIQRIPDDSNRNDDIRNSVYHIEKRSAEGTSPIKKASQNNEKKMNTKMVTTSIPIPSKKSTPENDIADALTNVTVTAELNVSMNQTKLNKEIYNTEIVSTPSTSTASMNVTTAPTVVTSDNSDDVFPTKPANATEKEDHHGYYNSTIYLESEKAMSFWVDFNSLPQTKIVTNHMLSASHRRAATVLLSFDFPFYGHPLRNITIATGGFLYMGGYMHSWLAATQYVAPLMANFDTSLSNSSTVRYYDNGTAFVIEWNEVSLQDEKQGGNFSFQATLLSSGDIIFVYQTIPVSVNLIGDEFHPVKIGLSDAYVIDRIIYFIRRKTIYEYHRLDMKKEEIGNQTAIYFTALTTCLTFRDCNSCMSEEIGLDCVWCESAKRCSDGLDRHRQDWLQQRCDVEKSQINCSALPGTTHHPAVQPFTEKPPKTYTLYPPPEAHAAQQPSYPFPSNYHEDDSEVTSHKVKGEEPVGVGGVIGILLILGIVLGIGTWIGYAYRNPHTSSGQLLIRYRPTQWRFRSGEARYTAASVHM